MSISVKNENNLDNLGFTLVKDEKFKSNLIKICFYTNLSEENVSKNAIISDILVSTNEKYKTKTELSLKLSELYGANLSGYVQKLGDMQVVGLAANCICDHFTLEGEKITEELVDILLDCIFNPVIEDGGFAKDEFNIRKRELLEDIDAEINEKISYAFLKASEVIYKGEPASLPVYGKKESALKLEPVSVYEAYKQLLENSKIEVSLVGGQDLSFAKEKIEKAFSKYDRKNSDNKFYALSPQKNEVEKAFDEMEVNQCKMIMAYKTDYSDFYANYLMTTMLGGTAFSKFFVNVREELSLCYYCSARFNEYKGTLLCDSGVEYDNVEAAKEAMNQQIIDLAEGKFSEDEMKNAILYISGNLKSVTDGLNDIANFYINQKVRGENLSPSEVYEKYSKLTAQDIINAAKALKLDTVYLMRPSDKAEKMA